MQTSRLLFRALARAFNDNKSRLLEYSRQWRSLPDNLPQEVTIAALPKIGKNVAFFNAACLFVAAPRKSMKVRREILIESD